jgi:hypothetical protein
VLHKDTPAKDADAENADENQIGKRDEKQRRPDSHSVLAIFFPKKRFQRHVVSKVLLKPHCNIRHDIPSVFQKLPTNPTAAFSNSSP